MERSKDQFMQTRMDVVGQNGNTGEHYFNQMRNDPNWDTTSTLDVLPQAGIVKPIEQQLNETYKATMLNRFNGDPIVESVINKYISRSNKGLKTYGTTLEENKAPISEWLTHLQEELMDAALYVEKLKSIL